MKLSDLAEAKSFNLYTQEPYGSGFDPAPVVAGEVLPTEDGGEAEFVKISADGKKLIVKMGGEEQEISPAVVAGIILPAGVQVKNRNDFSK